MSASQPLAQSRPDLPAAGRVLLSLLARLRRGSLRLITPDGEELWFGQPKQPADASLILRDWRACARILQREDIGFAESYRDGWLDSPDLTALLRLAQRNEDALQLGALGRLASRLWHRLRHALRGNSRRGSRRNIHAHYDIGNDFYRLWLDPSWTYSSAWFDGDYGRSLADAQAAKYQRICDELQLKPGMRVLEIGCGWGGFAEHAARRGMASPSPKRSWTSPKPGWPRSRWRGWNGWITATCAASTTPSCRSRCSRRWASATGAAISTPCAAA